MLHVLARHNEFGGEKSRVVMVKPVEQRLLSAACHNHNGQSCGLYLLQHLQCARHFGRFRTSVEQTALLLVYLLNLLGRGVAFPIAVSQYVDS